MRAGAGVPAAGLELPTAAPPSELEPPPPKTDRSMPALKCRPVLDSTTTRALASSLMPVTISGSSRQNSGVIVLSASGRDRRTWATWSAMSTSKQL